MDHFGPFVVKGKKKYWGLIFMCLTTRAVHLEDCASLDMKSFQMALDRFIQRRGKPVRMRSDQGTSFVKAAKEQEKTVEALARETESFVQNHWRIDFKFNPAGAPHWGGSWERMIQEVKKILSASFDSIAGLSGEAFRTGLVRAEGILNRRPIAFDDDGRAITPASLISPSSEENGGFPFGASSIDVLRKVRQAEEFFWRRWKTSYLNRLSVERIARGNVTAVDLKPGDPIILLDSSNPLVEKWATGRIIETYTSKDGFVRSALVETEGTRKIQDVRRIAIVEGAALGREKKPPSAPAPSSGGVSAP
jgi:hypothetical protein